VHFGAEITGDTAITVGIPLGLMLRSDHPVGSESRRWGLKRIFAPAALQGRGGDGGEGIGGMNEWH